MCCINLSSPRGAFKLKKGILSFVLKLLDSRTNFLCYVMKTEKDKKEKIL
jgi:hypothetical protein